MRITARLVTLFGGPARERDLQAEVEFHIDMRAAGYVRDGMRPVDAVALARQQFGDVEVAMNGMRRARLRSRAALLALASASVVAAGLWTYVSSLGNAPVVFPGIADVPRPMKFVKRPPPPPPGPTWEEFVAKVNTFGDGSDAKRRRR